jgi:GT2 family glycosyltransferase
MEYIINNGYEYFFIVEDDVIFCEHNVFDDMIKNANENTLTFINNCKNTWESQNPTNKGQSWRVQTAGYPVHFIKKVGVIDPRYFFRGEDLER